jgi:putative Holliday junction resolvase
MKGQKTIQTKNVIEFNKKLKLKIKIPIVFQDERLSSLSAEKSLIEQKIKTGYNKSKIDETAAAIFLQQFLDTKRL